MKAKVVNTSGTVCFNASFACAIALCLQANFYAIKIKIVYEIKNSVCKEKNSVCNQNKNIVKFSSSMYLHDFFI